MAVVVHDEEEAEVELERVIGFRAFESGKRCSRYRVSTGVIEVDAAEQVVIFSAA